MTEPRWFFWTRDHVDSPWRPFLLGSDEYARRTLGVRVPGGMVFVCLWRFRGWSGPCARCGQWEPTEHWEGTHCHSCSYEIADYKHGCTCPSFLDSGYLDQTWPALDCPVHQTV